MIDTCPHILKIALAHNLQFWHLLPFAIGRQNSGMGTHSSHGSTAVAVKELTVDADDRAVIFESHD